MSLIFSRSHHDPELSYSVWKSGNQLASHPHWSMSTRFLISVQSRRSALPTFENVLPGFDVLVSFSNILCAASTTTIPEPMADSRKAVAHTCRTENQICTRRCLRSSRGRCPPPVEDPTDAKHKSQTTPVHLAASPADQSPISSRFGSVSRKQWHIRVAVPTKYDRKFGMSERTVELACACFRSGYRRDIFSCRRRACHRL